jgi:hypothetical protein
MKIIVFGDIHGRTCWKKILEHEKWDKVIFLGDYVSTHEKISENDQILNLQDIFDFKKEYGDKVILLRGNHDIQHLGYSWAECSGMCRNVQQFMMEFKEEFLENTQWLYIEDNYLFSHAGVSKIWWNNIKNRHENIIDIEDINKLEPSEEFGFTPDNWYDYSGYSDTQPLTWIRPENLINCGVNNYIQVVGHTPTKPYMAGFIQKENVKIYLNDALPYQSLVIEDGKAKVIDI